MTQAQAPAPEACRKCGNPFVDDGKYADSAARSGQTPFCGTCVGICHDTEIADHWCEIDQWRHETRMQQRAMTEAQAMERAREVWPEAEGFLPHTRGWTFRVGGGYASVTAGGVVARDAQGTRFDAVSYMGRRTMPASTQEKQQ